MKDSILKFKELDHSSLLKMLQEKSFNKKYPSYNVITKKLYYIIKDGKSLINIYKNEVEVNITFEESDRKCENFKINSSLNFQKICKDKEINLDSLYVSINKVKKVYYSPTNCANILPYIMNNKINFISQKRESLPETKILKRSFFENKCKIKDYSSFHKDYFGDIAPESEFIFISSVIRQNIEGNLNNLLLDDINEFKFTGPCSIGKSITLLNFCRQMENAFYLNLKLINNKPRKESYMILKEEFSNVDNDLFPEIKDIIERDYYKDFLPFQTILKLIDFFIAKKIFAIFVFDQSKEKYNSNLFYDKIIKSGSNIKVVLCSSINDKKMRDECCKTWINCDLINMNTLTVKNQKYYFYYDKLYEKIFDNLNKIEKLFNGITKYIKQYEEKDDNKDSIDKENVDKSIGSHIIKKIEEFYENKDFTLDLALTIIKNLINKEYEISKLSNILQYIPLKYFVIDFIGNDHFVIKMHFPFLNYVINKNLTDKEVNDYFIKEKYLKSFIENDSVKGDYFEIAVKEGIKNNYIILPAKINYSIILEEIVTMEVVEDNKEEDFLEEEKIDEVSSKNNKIILEYDDLEQIEETSIESETNNNLKENYFHQNENNILGKLLNNFEIDLETKVIDDDIENYRRKEKIRIIEKNVKINIPKIKYNGNKNYLIDQRKKKGRMLDYAFLYGDKKNKIFIGFQIKCYFKSTKSIDNKFITKNMIKKECQQILFQSMLTFDCKITKWYYYLIFYYNPNKKDCNVNPLILNQCKNNIGILFYDPVKLEFYDINYQPINSLELDSVSDLDMKNEYLQMEIINVNEIEKIRESISKDELEKTFLKDFGYMKCDDLSQILKNIGTIMKIKNNLSLNYKIRDNKYIKVPPKSNYVHLYKQKDEGFIGVKSVFEINKFKYAEYYDLNSGLMIDIDEYYSRIDLKFNYIYSLRIKMTRKRNYNSLVKESKERGQPINNFHVSEKLFKAK